MKKLIIIPLLISSTFLISKGVSAGPFTEQLSRCLVTSTSVDDRNDLVRWMFSAAAKHPAVKDLVNVTPEILENSNKKMGELMTRLLTVSCLKETKEALKYEGNATIEASFNALGQVAGKEMFSHPQVAEGMSNLEKYIDTETINKLIK